MPQSQPPTTSPQPLSPPPPHPTLQTLNSEPRSTKSNPQTPNPHTSRPPPHPPPPHTLTPKPHTPHPTPFTTLTTPVFVPGALTPYPSTGTCTPHNLNPEHKTRTQWGKRRRRRRRGAGRWGSSFRAAGTGRRTPGLPFWECKRLHSPLDTPAATWGGGRPACRSRRTHRRPRRARTP